MRSFLKIGTPLVASALLLTACGGTSGGDDDASEGGGGGGENCELSIGFFGALTGPASNLGVNIRNGAQLAVSQYNEENADCEVELTPYDSQGDENAATGLATEAVGDENIIGVVGPAFSGESRSAGPIFAEGGLPTISASATNPALSENGWATFHRVVGNDNSQGPAAAQYISDVLGSTKAFVIDDASEYGAGLATIVKEDLGDAVVGENTIQAGQTDFAATITAINDSGADAVFFGGYYAEAGLIVSQLRDAGSDATFVVADGVNDPGYLDAAGDAAEGTIITCPCQPSTENTEFIAAFEEEFGTPPATYSAESYDAANVFLDGIADGVTDREGMLEFIKGYSEDGLTKTVAFDDTGEPTEVVVWAFKVEGGEIVGDQEIAPAAE